MYWLLALITGSLLLLISLGIHYEIHPLPANHSTQRRLKSILAFNLITFILAQLGLLLLGIQEVMAAPTGPETVHDISIGMGLAILGIGIPTAFSTIGAGIAVGPVGAASLAVIAEKPEMFGRTLLYLGLAEGIAIYGLVVSILLLGKI